MPSDRSTTVAIPAAWLAGLPLLGAILGCAASFAIGPAVTWLLGVAGDAPGLLRLAALIPLPWALPVLGLAGLILGCWVAREWWKENGTI